jgi:hypothetical protein
MTRPALAVPPALTFAFALSLPVAACGGDDPKESGAAAAAGECPGLPAGTYAASGSCFGMEMTVELTPIGDDCAFTLTGWSMDHGDAPDGGQVSGADVSLTGPGFEGCTGELTDGALSGLCPDGCAWDLRHAG